MAKARVNEGHISKAMLRNTRVSAQKARLVVNMIRGKKVDVALDELRCCTKSTAPVVEKLLLSAVANADNKQSGVDIDELYVKSAWVDEGKTYHRFMPRAHGRATPIKKRHSTITVVLDEGGAN